LNTHSLVACHECDLLQQLPALSPGQTCRCVRCGAFLHRFRENSIERSLALTFAGAVLFILANGFPFLAFKMEATVQETTLITGVHELYRQGMWEVALLVFFTTILAPALHLSGLLYILVPLHLGRVPVQMAWVLRMIGKLQPWSMMEVFMLGILVSVVKLAKMAQIVPGISLYAFLVLIFVLAAITANLDTHLLWQRWEERR
jgi:paraquat-inducible protein A